jgi:hypothetical protein
MSSVKGGVKVHYFCSREPVCDNNMQLCVGVYAVTVRN